MLIRSGWVSNWKVLTGLDTRQHCSCHTSHALVPSYPAADSRGEISFRGTVGKQAFLADVLKPEEYFHRASDHLGRSWRHTNVPSASANPGMQAYGRLWWHFMLPRSLELEGRIGQDRTGRNAGDRCVFPLLLR